MSDVIFQRFLDNQAAAAAQLCRESDVLRVHTDPRSPATFLCEFAVPFLYRLPDGVAQLHSGPVLAAVHFPPDYLRSADPQLYLRVAAVLTPNLVHPNIRGTGVCLGSAFRPGTGLVVVLRELYEIFAYSNCTLVESNAMNPEACRLLRAHRHLVDALEPRPLARRTRKLRVQVGKA